MILPALVLSSGGWSAHGRCFLRQGSHQDGQVCRSHLQADGENCGEEWTEQMTVNSYLCFPSGRREGSICGALLLQSKCARRARGPTLVGRPQTKRRNLCCPKSDVERASRLCFPPFTLHCLPSMCCRKKKRGIPSLRGMTTLCLWSVCEEIHGVLLSRQETAPRVEEIYKLNEEKVIRNAHKEMIRPALLLSGGGGGAHGRCRVRQASHQDGQVCRPHHDSAELFVFPFWPRWSICEALLLQCKLAQRQRRDPCFEASGPRSPETSVDFFVTQVLDVQHTRTL